MLENKIRKFVLRKGLLPGSPFLIISGLIFISFLIYIVLRAIYIPITHDEAGTILNYASQSLFDIITYKDPVPNNHILNTLLVKLFVNVFGYSELICRLPAIAGGVLYILFAIRLSWYFYYESILYFTVFIIVLIANPFVTEFFSLARGYGLATGLMVGSIYYLISSEKQIYPDHKIFLAVCFASLGVYANLTLLNYYMPVLFLIVLFKWKQIKAHIIQLSVVPIVLFALLYLPIKKMLATNQFQYWGNTSFMAETFEPLLKSSIHGQGYFAQFTLSVFTGLCFLSFGFISLINIFRYYHSKRISEIHIAVLLFVLAVLYNITQHIFLQIPYLNARTSIFYYPLFVISTLFTLFTVRRNGFCKIIRVCAVVMGLFSLLHMSRTFNISSSYEWWFDADNKTVLNTIVKKSSNSSNINLKCNWLFQPSFSYYLKTDQEYKKILSIPYNKQIDTSDIPDYYYVTSDDMNDWLKNNFTIDTSFAWNTRFLLKKK